MKKTISFFLALVMIACTFAITNVQTAATDYSQYDLTYYDADIYTDPFWQGNVVVNEAVYPVLGENGERNFKLLYPATEIIAVRSFNYQTLYQSGRDYTLTADGDLYLPLSTTIQTHPYEFVHPSSYPSPSYGDYYPHTSQYNEPGCGDAGYDWWINDYKSISICVTYVHADDDRYDNARPQAMGDVLPNSMYKLMNDQPITILFVGDSIGAGGNASGGRYGNGSFPSAPSFPLMTAQGLAAKFGNTHIDLVNNCRGGTTSDYDASANPLDSLYLYDNFSNNHPNGVSPDLVLITYGANDSSQRYTDERFYNYTKAHIDFIKAYTNAEILLVSSPCGNYNVFSEPCHRSHADILHQLANEYGTGVGVCDIQTIQSEMELRKTHEDFTDDNIIHPSDMGHRLVAQSIIDCLRYETPTFAASSAVSRIRSAVSPARGKEALYNMLAGDNGSYYDYFVSLGSAAAINAAVPAKIAELGQLMKYCADGYHDFDPVTLPAQCGQNGRTSEVCVYCGLEQNVQTIYASSLPAFGHSLSYTSSGGVGYWLCSVCGRAFDSSDASNEITAPMDAAASAVNDMILALDEPVYQGVQAFSGSGIVGTFGTGGSMEAYSVLEMNEGESKLNKDYALELTVRLRNVDTDTQIGGASGAFFGLYCQSFTVGYDFASDQWGISRDYGLWAQYAFVPVVRGQFGVLDDGLFHVVRFECKTNGISVFVDGVRMLHSTDIVRQNNNFGIFYPRLCTADFARYVFEYNGVTVEDLTGAAIPGSATWTCRGAGYSETVTQFTGTAVTDNGADIAAVEDAFNDLTPAERQTVVNAQTLEDIRASYDALSKPSAAMSGSPDSSKIKANVYITLPARADARNYTANFGGESSSLADMTASANGYRFSVTVPAKNMGDLIAYSVTDYYGDTVRSGSVSIKNYMNALAAYYPQYSAFVGSALTYGAAAQAYFGYDTAHPVSNADLTALSPVSGSRFDYEAIQTAMHADDTIPVFYNAMNVTFLADTTLSLAFGIKDGFSNEAALAWVNAFVTLGGESLPARISVNSSNGLRFVIIRKQNIAITAVTDQMNLAFGARTYGISVLNYFTAVEEAGSDNLKYLTRALYAYSQAAQAISGN